jgi:tRNA-specific 2-thiouridylase
MSITGSNTYQQPQPHRPGSQATATRKRILVGISGGQSSAVTAALLKSQGYDVIGVHFQLFDPKKPLSERFAARCCLTKSVEAAQEVCKKLDINLQVTHLEDRFEDRVIDYFVHELLMCRSPNPCIPCNRDIRFQSLFEQADELGCEMVATGHHAQIFHDAAVVGKTSLARLQKGINPDKDQSYLLFGLTQKQLLRMIMPAGGFQDVMIARLAHEFGLPEIPTPSPAEACLTQAESYRAFVENRTAPSLRPRGVVKLAQGTAMGDHMGLHAYRVGQKVKLAPNIKDADQYLVTGFEPQSYSLLVGVEKDLYGSEIRANHANWIRPLDMLRGLKCTARVSASQQDAVPCRVTQFENATVRVEFEIPLKGLLAGQAVVFYEGEEVLGGAIIETTGSLPLEKYVF